MEEKNLDVVYNQYGKEIDFDFAVFLMDDYCREIVHNETAPCSNQEFFDNYIRVHKMVLGFDFELDKENPCY